MGLAENHPPNPYLRGKPSILSRVINKLFDHAEEKTKGKETFLWDLARKPFAHIHFPIGDSG
jgi:hypothetical protein